MGKVSNPADKLHRELQYALGFSALQALVQQHRISIEAGTNVNVAFAERCGVLQMNL